MSSDAPGLCDWTVLRYSQSVIIQQLIYTAQKTQISTIFVLNKVMVSWLKLQP